MQYGLTLPNGSHWGGPQVFGDLARLAEDSGWDGVFFEDYIVWQSNQAVPTYDPWILLAVVAIRTSRIRLGTMVTPLARRRPWKVARETVSLDHLSSGRLILGVGLGDVGDAISADISFTHFHEMINGKERARMLDEALDVLVGLWSGKPFSYNGRYYQIKEITLLPKPVQRPRIPIWVGGGYPLKGPVMRAARWDGSCLYKYKGHHLTPEEIRALREIVLEQRGTLDGYDIHVGGSERRADWEEERDYIRSLSEAGVTWWNEYIPPEAGDLETVRGMIRRGPLRID